jgi:hypothetical protein
MKCSGPEPRLTVVRGVSQTGCQQIVARRRGVRGERLLWLRFHDVRRRSSFLLDLGKQPGLNRGGCPFLLRVGSKIISPRLNDHSSGRLWFGFLFVFGDDAVVRVRQMSYVANCLDALIGHEGTTAG